MSKYLGEAWKKIHFPRMKSKNFNEVRHSVSLLQRTYDSIAEIRRNLEALDNEVGGTSMMKDINKQTQKTLSSLNFLTDSIASALHEYRGMLANTNEARSPDPKKYPHLAKSWGGAMARKHGSTQMECMECGHKFKKKLGRNTVEVKCPKCKGYDTDVA